MNIKVINAISYLRVSSEEQTHNFSLDNQKDYCEKYCKDNEFRLIKTFVDAGKSATSIEGRPALLELLEFARKNKGQLDYLICYKLDRISRSTLDFLVLKKRLASYGVRIISVTEPTQNDDPASEFLETILAAVSRLDNETRKQRVVHGLKKRLLAGLPTNQPPIGYKMQKDATGRSVPVRNEPTFSLLQKVGYEYLTGNYSFQQLANFINNIGVRTMYGKKFNSNAAGKFIRGMFYKGVIYSRKSGEEFKGKFEPMFSIKDWDLMQEIASGKPFATKKRQMKELFPLRGFVYCGLSKTPLTGSVCKKRYAYYYSPTKVKSTLKSKLEAEFIDVLDCITPKEGVLETFTQVLNEKYEDKYKLFKELEGTTDFDMNQTHGERFNLIQARQHEQITREEFADKFDEFEDKLAVLGIRKSEAIGDKLNIESIKAFAEHFLTHLGHYWRVSKLDERKQLQWLIFPKGLIYNYPGFSTTEICSLFNVNQSSSLAYSSFGGGGEDRTPDTRLKRPLLYH